MDLEDLHEYLAGTCSACTSIPTASNVCQRIGFIGLSGWGGGLSSAIVLPESYIVPLPSHIPLEIGALVEPLSVGWHAVNLCPPTPESTILIVGGGPIGIAVIAALRAQAPTCQIIVSEVSTKRMEFLKEFGADFVLDPRSVSVVWWRRW